MKMKQIVLLTAMLTLVFSGTLVATNGYFSHGYGAKSKAMAGAGTAMSLSTLDSATNPAALVFLGKRFDIGFGLFMPFREFTVSGMPSMYPGTFPLNPGTVESDSKLFLMPYAGANFMLNENTAIGIAVYGNGGMNTNYDAAVFHGSTPTGVNLAQMFADVTISRKLGENHAVGLTFIGAFQMFEAKGLQAFGNFTVLPDNLTDNGTDTSLGYGFRFGYMGKFSKYLAIGASYQTKIKMQEFEKYAGLFAELGGFDIPAAINAGIAVNLTDSITLALDFQKVMYSKVKAICNPFKPSDLHQGLCLGDSAGPGFGWEDVTTYKFGVQWAMSKMFTLRGGYSYCNQPIPETEVMLNILAPGVIQQHITFGGTFFMSGTKELSFYVMYALPNSVTGDNPMEFPGQQTIKLEMKQLEFGLEFSF